MIYIYY